jgi:quercetin dioxygenase-like cupin family protein
MLAKTLRVSLSFVAGPEHSILRGSLEEDVMKIIRMDKTPKEPFMNPIFTGDGVTIQKLVPDSKDFNLNVVHFPKGVGNKLHTHDSEQILIITSGKGIVATEKEEKIVTAGDVILFPAGEKHWHGATDDSEFSHVYVTRMGSETRIA